MRKCLLVIYLLIVSYGIIQAQQTEASGRIIDASGNPLYKVSVSEKGTNNGTSTDANGSFVLRLQKGGRLLISSIGFSPLELDAAGGLLITLQSNQTALSEVVVTALGIRREKKALGYSVTEIKGDQLTQSNNQNFVNSLNGRVAGLQVVSSGGAPGQGSRVIIRGGAKSIRGNNEPLFVIDGIPVSNSNDGNNSYTEVEGAATPNRIADINPDDVETISVLKGSAASVLYGNRGANGVILITTKSGKGKNGKPVITFSNTVGFDNALKLPDFQKVYAQGNGNYLEGGSRSFGPKIQGQQVFSNAKGENIALTVHDPRKDFLETGINYNTNISVAQAKENSSYFISAGHSHASSIVPNQDYNKASIRLNVNNQVSSRLNLTINSNYLRTWGDVPYLGQDGNNPFFALFNMPVSWDIKGFGYQRDDGRQINFRGGAFDNPLWTVNKTFFNTTEDRLISAASLSYKAFSWMDISYRLGIDQLNDERKSFRDINTGSFPNGALANDQIRRQEITSTLFLTINKHFSKDVGFSFTGGQDYNQRKITEYTQTGTAIVIPGIAHMSNVAAFDPDYEFQSKRRMVGVFGDLKLDYRNFIFLGFAARNEWSSTLPVQNRSFFYPGANLSLVFTDLLKGGVRDILSYGKLRIGYAQTARDPEPYQVINTFVVPGDTPEAGFGDGFVAGSAPLSFPFNGVAGYTASNILNNRNLKAEKTSELEAGAELRFLKDRISLDVTWFYNRNTNGIVPVDISPATGATNLVINSGLTRVKGIEASLTVIPVRTSSFKWEATMTFSRTRSKVVETFPGVAQVFLGGFGGNPAIYAVKGERYGSIIGTGYQKNDQGQVLVDADGFPLFADGVNLGYIEPDWTGGIRNNVTFKNFSLDFLIDTRQGGYIYNGTEELLDFYGVTKKTESREADFIFPGVKEADGKANDIVVKRDATWWSFAQGNEEYVYKNNWVRLREANLSYNLLLNKKYLQSVTVGVYGRNLWLSTKVPHVDPESSSFGTNNGQGATRMAFPSLRSLGFNLKFIF